MSRSLRAVRLVSGRLTTFFNKLLNARTIPRRLAPGHGNLCKRLIRSPKVHARDSGLVHALLGIGDREALLAHPVAGESREGMAIESLTAAGIEAIAVADLCAELGAPSAGASFWTANSLPEDAHIESVALADPRHA